MISLDYYILEAQRILRIVSHFNLLVLANVVKFTMLLVLYEHVLIMCSPSFQVFHEHRASTAVIIMVGNKKKGTRGRKEVANKRRLVKGKMEKNSN